jgi:hypothetical protein
MATKRSRCFARYSVWCAIRGCIRYASRCGTQRARRGSERKLIEDGMDHRSGGSGNRSDCGGSDYAAGRWRRECHQRNPSEFQCRANFHIGACVFGGGASERCDCGLLSMVQQCGGHHSGERDNGGGSIHRALAASERSGARVHVHMARSNRYGYGFVGSAIANWIKPVWILHFGHTHGGDERPDRNVAVAKRRTGCRQRQRHIFGCDVSREVADGRCVTRDLHANVAEPGRQRHSFGRRRASFGSEPIRRGDFGISYRSVCRGLVWRGLRSD